MLLAINQHGALHILASTKEAEIHFEAIDVMQEAIEFCDTDGQRYEVHYTRKPRVGRFSSVDIGAFQLISVGEVDESLPRDFLNRASDVESSTVPNLKTLGELKDRLGLY